MCVIPLVNKVILPYIMADKQLGYEQMNRAIKIMHFLSVVFVLFVCCIFLVGWLFSHRKYNIEETFRNR